MATVIVSEKNIQEIVEKKGVVLLDFWASWCGPCRSFGPIFEAASSRHPDVTFGKVNTELEPSLAAAFQIRSIPTIAVLRDGVLLAMQPGALSGPMLDELLRKVKALEMSAVSKTVSQKNAGGL